MIPNLYEIHYELPSIPEELHKSECDIRKIKDEFADRRSEIDPNSKPKYTLHTAPPEIKDFLLPHFGKQYEFAFQLITSDLPIHKDFGRRSCFNYIFSSGGDVSTNWYDDNLNQIKNIVFPENTWHKIKVDTFHNVTNFTSTRIALSVWEKDETAIGSIS